MKIGYITIHYGNNFGTILQTYALYEIIRHMEDIDIELIYYIPDHYLNKKDNSIKVTSFKSLILKMVLPQINKAISRKYVHFIKKNVQVTKLYTLEGLKNKKLDYDLLLVGSDQVWNTTYNNGIDDIYYLDFSHNIKKRVSYASSFGKTEFNNYEKSVIRNKLKNFDYISVRENDAKLFINELGFQNVEQVLDPTLLFSMNQWKKLIKGEKKRKEKYILIYALDENIEDISLKARNIANEKNLSVIMISNNLTRNRLVDRVYCYNTVSDFLNLVYNAELIITNSFHGTVFSINFNKQFIVLKKSKYNSRIESVLNLFNLSDRQIELENIENTNLYNTYISYDKVNIILEKEREKSMNYLEYVIHKNNREKNVTTNKC